MARATAKVAAVSADLRGFLRRADTPNLPAILQRASKTTGLRPSYGPPNPRPGPLHRVGGRPTVAENL
jgi:hypothetical protein